MIVHILVIMFTGLHLLAALLPHPILLKKFNPAEAELFRQHHEKCVMLGMIALAILDLAA